MRYQYARPVDVGFHPTPAMPQSERWNRRHAHQYTSRQAAALLLGCSQSQSLSCRVWSKPLRKQSRITTAFPKPRRLGADEPRRNPVTLSRDGACLPVRMMRALSHAHEPSHRPQFLQFCSCNKSFGVMAEDRLGCFVPAVLAPCWLVAWDILGWRKRQSMSLARCSP